MKITYYSDYTCPWCYIGREQIKQAIKQLGAENDIEWEAKVYELYPDAPTEPFGTNVELFARQQGMPESAVRSHMDEVSQRGRDLGLDFNLATASPVNTMAAHRLTKYVAKNRSKEESDRFVDTLFDAYFGKNRILTDDQVLKSAARQAGLSDEESESIIRGEAYLAEARRDEREAHADGVGGVPFYKIGNYEVHGAASVERFKKVIAMALADEKSSIANVDDEHVCGPDGCVL